MTSLPRLRKIAGPLGSGRRGGIYLIDGTDVTVASTAGGGWLINTDPAWLERTGLARVRFRSRRHALDAFVAQHAVTPAPPPGRLDVLHVPLVRRGPGRYVTADDVYEVTGRRGSWSVFKTPSGSGRRLIDVSPSLAFACRAIHTDRQLRSPDQPPA